MKRSGMDTLKSEFKSYRADAISPKAPAIQLRECRRAFFVGAQSAVKLLAQAADAPTEDEGVVLLEVLHQELRAFGDKVGKGKA